MATASGALFSCNTLLLEVDTLNWVQHCGDIRFRRSAFTLGGGVRGLELCAAMVAEGWLLAIGAVWGITNALLKRGVLIADEAKRAAEKNEDSMVGGFLGDWIRVLCVWQYSLPFLLNLSMSVLFIIKLGSSPITLAVPVTNATTFAVTAVAGALLGEKTRPLETLVGVALIVAGVTLCISPPMMIDDFRASAASEVGW